MSAGRFPFPVPTGWFAVAWSDDVAAGGVRALRYFAREFVRQFRQDIPIWEAKQFLPRPILCEGDGAVASFRRWASQFYAGEAVAP